MEFVESRTYGNLLKAMDGEMRASTRYGMYADKAESEGLRPVANVFNELSRNEKEHAEVWNRLRKQGKEASTLDNLKSAVTDEQNEWMRMYEEFANVAAEEGYNDISDMFRRVALIEHHHDIILTGLIRLLENNGLFCSEDEQLWICTNCGYLYYGKCAPDICPVCGFPQEYYEKFNGEDDISEN